jgi:hypothetical protein
VTVRRPDEFVSTTILYGIYLGKQNLGGLKFCVVKTDIDRYRINWRIRLYFYTRAIVHCVINPCVYTTL